MPEKLKEVTEVNVRITGQSAKDLLFVGKEDLINHFSPKGLFVKSEDCEVWARTLKPNPKSMTGHDEYRYSNFE